MLTWRCFKSSLLQLHSARRISSGMFVPGTFTLCSFLPLSTPLFLSLALLFHSPSYTLKSPSRNLSWKPVYCYTHASCTSFCEQFFYMQIAFVRSRAFSVQSSTEIITFLSNHGFFYNKINFLWSKFVNEYKKRTNFHVYQIESNYIVFYDIIHIKI